MPLRTVLLAAVIALSGAAATSASAADPPFDGTVYISPSIITAKDPTAFTKESYRGTGTVEIYDHRPAAFVRRKVYRSVVRFSDGQTIKVYVNREFRRSSRARALARKYGRIIGRLPVMARQGMKMVGINRGPGGLAANEGGEVTIAVDGTRFAEREGFLEEAFLHEGIHAGLDRTVLLFPEWQAAMQADPLAISTYARDNPDTEDLAETIVPWFALRVRPQSLSAGDRRTIEQAIPNRLARLDALGLDLAPFGR